ncbi:MAG: hypothetical protein J0I65_28165, partial [Variovorax sp.]|nr:hypothetical protein [Variovorax sp.]
PVGADGERPHRPRVARQVCRGRLVSAGQVPELDRGRPRGRVERVPAGAGRHPRRIRGQGDRLKRRPDLEDVARGSCSGVPHACGPVRADRRQGVRAFLDTWLKEIGYEQHLYDGEDSEPAAAARWTNVMEFCDWMAQRCGGKIADASGADPTTEEPKSLLEVAQTISLLSTISEREQDQNVLTLSTLHASKGLEWPHVLLIGVNEGLLPFKLDDDEGRQEKVNESVVERLQEERRLMYVGITRAQRSLAVSWTKRRKKGREMLQALPSRFIAEMALDKTTAREDPRAKLKALREEFARKAQASAAAAAAAAGTP